MATAQDETEYETDPEEAQLSLKTRRREASDDEPEAAEGGGVRAQPPRTVEVDGSGGESEGAAADYDDEFEEYDSDEEIEEKVNNGDGEINEESVGVEDGQFDGEKKEVEAFAVPTAGAFYMHDDRFRGNAVGRNSRMLGGRKLWESKDDRKWGHDKFEELTTQETSYEEHRRGSKGRNRGRGTNRAADHGYARVNRPRELTDNGPQNSNNQNSAPKGFKGRGPRRYQPPSNNKAPFIQTKQSGKSNGKVSYVRKERKSESMSNAEPDVVLPRKQVLASNLNIASPPFYPSGSSTKDDNVPNKRDVQAGPINRNGHQSVMVDSFAVAQFSGSMRGKNTVDSIDVDKLYIDDSLSTQQHLRGQGRGVASLSQMVYQPAVSNDQVGKVNPSNQLQNVQRNTGQSRAQSFAQASSQQFTRRAPSPPIATGAVNAVESEAPSESNKSKTALISKGGGSAQGSGRGSFLYGGAHVMGASGNIGNGRGDPNFPAFLPVMQFSGQHPGGMGVPAVGMAFPGYVGQPQPGRGNSEMTWLPVLTGAAGALGSGYCPPYIAVDGSYQARPSGQLSSVTAASSKENNTTNVGNEWKPAQRPDSANDEFSQRQKNPRRYTEMKFDQ